MSSFAAADLNQLLDQLVAEYGDRAAVIGERSALSFRQLGDAARAWAQRLQAAGFGPGSHVGLLGGNGPEWLAAAFGVWRTGAVLVPVSTFVSGRELHDTLAHAGVDALVMQPRLRGHDYEALLTRGARPERVRSVLPLHAPFVSPSVVSGEGAYIDPESNACILYTSGTTGRAKGVMLSHRAILATTGPTAERAGLGTEDSLLSTLPLFWVAGLVIRALPTLWSGCSLLLVEAFSPDAVVAALRRHRPTAVHWRPPQIAQVIAHPDFEPALLSRVRRGSGRTQWFGDLLDSDARLITGYGMTETAGYVTALHWDDSEDVRRTQFGSLLPGVQIRIVDTDGRPLPPGAVGEIRVRAPGLFSGYYGEPPGTGFDADGWFVTGDLGSVAADGRFQFTGRTKDLLRSRGINVSPVEVERVLGEHPGVEAAYVVGLPDDALEQRIVALVVAKEGAPATEEVLRAYVSGLLSHYKRPEVYVFIERNDVPLSGTSKPERAALAELALRRLPAPPAGSEPV